MTCAGCMCNFCARSCELYSGYFTPGEVDECCFTCDDCRNYDGDHRKKSMHRFKCPYYIKPQKYAEMENRRAEAKAKTARSKFRLIDHRSKHDES